MKRVMILIFISLVLLNVAVVSAACSSDQIIMKLYQEKNSHGALWNDANYKVDICFTDFFGGEYTGASPHACKNNNKALGLYSTTNSHGEIPSLDNYNVDVCYGDLVCKAKTSCASDEATILSLYFNTNSHISKGNDANYPVKICCKSSIPVKTNDGICGPADGQQYQTLSKTDPNLCSQGSVDKFKITTNPDGWTWNCVGSESTASCSAEKTIPTYKCPDGPSPNIICEGVIVEIYDTNNEVCKTIIGTSTDPSCDSCPIEDYPASNICKGLSVPVKNSKGIICDTVIGTSTDPSCDSCPIGPDPSTICSGDFENVKNTNNNICKVIWGTKDCGECTFSSASWSTPGPVVAGSVVEMIVTGTGCEGKQIKFEIWEKDFLGNNYVDTITGTFDRGSWTTIWIEDEGGTGDPEYIFKAILVEDESMTKTSGGELDVKKRAPTTGCAAILTCGDYKQQEECIDDGCNVGGYSDFYSYTPGGGDCEVKDKNECVWKTNGCKLQTTYRATNNGECGTYTSPLCVYDETTSGDCGAGDEFFSVEYTLLESSGTCEEPPIKEFLCPSQVALPFFTAQNIILVIVVIVLIYLILNAKKKKKRR